MMDVIEYLKINYLPKFVGARAHLRPTVEQLSRAVNNCQDKVVIVRDDKVRGVGIFLNLSDESYATLKSLNLTDVEIVSYLLKQHGPNVHFVLLCADGYKTIMTGIRMVKRKLNPKTISWWNPDLKVLHQYKVGA